MKFLIAISTLLVASVVAQHKTSYNGYKLVDISLQDLDQVKFLNSLEDVDPEVLRNSRLSRKYIDQANHIFII